MPQKLKDILTSKKFWATISAIALIWVAYSQGTLVLSLSVQDTIAAIAAYVIAVGIEDNGKAQG